MDSRIEKALPEWQNIDSIAKIIKKPDWTKFETEEKAKEFLREQFLKWEIKSLDIKNEKDWTTKYEKFLEKNSELNKLNTEKNPEFVKELIWIYWDEEIEGYSKILSEKNVKTLEEADKVIVEETKKRLVKAWMLDENWNPLSEEEKKKRLEELKKLKDAMDKNPDLANQMIKRMSKNQWISESEARNVEAEPLNLTWPEKDRATNLIKHFEWFVSTPYWDYKQRTHWFWTKAKWPWDVITRQKAHEELKDRLEKNIIL